MIVIMIMITIVGGGREGRGVGERGDITGGSPRRQGGANPQNGAQKKSAPKGGAPKGGGPKISRFFPSPATIFVPRQPKSPNVHI